MLTETSRLVSSRLVSAILLSLIAVFASEKQTFADPPCAVMSVAPEGGESVCLDDWIRFNQKLWIDLFWPTQFDAENPLLLVHERLGMWANPVSTLGRNQQGEDFWIDVGVPPEPTDLPNLLAEGAITFEEYQSLLSVDFSGGDSVALLTSVDAGFQVWMRVTFLSMRAPNGEYLNLITPYEEFDLKNDEIASDPGLCAVPICACAAWNLPDLTPQYEQQYFDAVCQRQVQNGNDIRDAQDALRRCKLWSFATGFSGIVGGCLGIACAPASGPFAPAVAAGGGLMAATGGATVIKGNKDCKATFAATLNQIAANFNLFVENQCLQNCISSSNQP